MTARRIAQIRVGSGLVKTPPFRSHDQGSFEMDAEDPRDLSLALFTRWTFQSRGNAPIAIAPD